MGGKFSKRHEKNTEPPSESSSDSNSHGNPDLSSYQAAVRTDPDLRTFDSTAQVRTSRAINSIAVNIDVRSLSLDSLREVAECFMEMNQDAVRIILESKRDIWKNDQLFDLVNDYLQNSLHILDFCTALDACLQRARRSQSIIQAAIQKFEEEKAQNVPAQLYSRTLEELNNFKAAGDPFSEEFFALFQKVLRQLEMMLDKIRAKKRKLDKKLSKVRAWRKVSNVLFATVFVSVLICSVVAAAVTAPPVVTALAAAAAVPLGTVGKWFNSMWRKYERELRGQREIISSMQIGGSIVINDLENIRVLVDRLQIKIEALLQNANFATREDDAVVIAVEEIKNNVDAFIKTIHDLTEHASKCRKDITMARGVILRRIMSHPRPELE